MTLEDFFLADYEKLRERVKELEAELEQLKPHKYGIVDLGKPQDMVCVRAESIYSIDDKVTTLEEAQRLYGMDKKDLLHWALNTTVSYGTKAITINRETLPFTVRVTTLISSHEYATDGNSRYEQLDFMEECMEDNLDAWCLPEYEDALVNAAVQDLRDTLGKLVERYEKQAEETA